LIVQSTLLIAQESPCIQADSLISANDFIKAASFYLSCYEQDTFDKKPLASLAFCYFQMGDYGFFKFQCLRLENDSINSLDAIAKLALIYESQQNLPKAIKYYNALHKSNPQNAVYLRKLGNLYLQGREPTQAHESYKQALFLNPRDLLTIQALTEIYLSTDDLFKSDSISDIGIALDSTNISMQLLKARIKYRLRDYNTAASILQKLTHLTELNNYFNKLLGYSMMQIDSLDKAIFYLQKSLIQENDPEYALFYLALAYEKKQEYEKATWFYEEAVKAGISENLSQYYRGLARIKTQQEDYKSVLDFYKKSLDYQKSPDV